MIAYFLIGAALVAGLLLYRKRALARFDADPDQQRLSDLLVAHASGKDSAKIDIYALLDGVATSPANRRARVVHAVLLARKSTPPVLYARVVELSRTIR